MQNLVDVESGLAEAHLAVESQAADANSDEIAIDDESDPIPAAQTDTSTFLAEAEKVEGALESAIPPAPSASDPRLQAQALAAAPSNDHYISQTATEAQQSMDAVNVDITAPVLPEQVAEPAHDVVMETTIEEETSPMQVDVEEEEEVRPRYDPSEPQGTYEPPQRYDPSVPQDQAPVRYDPSEPQDQDEVTPRPRYDPSEPQDTAPVSYDPSVPQTTFLQPPAADSSHPAQAREPSLLSATASSPAAADDVKPAVQGSDPRLQSLPIKPEVTVKSEFPSLSNSDDQSFGQPLPGLPLGDLPDGITEQSPSVINNKDAANSWRASEFLLTG
jgi:hypothetical protein